MANAKIKHLQLPNGTTYDFHAVTADSATSATTASKLDTNAGSATNPVYFTGGVPTACTYSLNKTVPSDAVFTDQLLNQRACINSLSYEILFAGTTSADTKTEWANKSVNLTYVPSSGTLTTTIIDAGLPSPVAIANNDRLVITDASNSSKLGRTTITFDGSTTNKALTPAGTWESFMPAGIKYAGASYAGGSATSAVRLDTSTAGSATQPCYFANGVPSACTYSLNKTVPSDAVFTDTNTHRPIQVNGTEILGNNTTALNLKAGSNVSVTNSSGTVTIAATDTNTTYTLGTSGSSLTLTPSSGTEQTVGITDTVKNALGVDTTAEATLFLNKNGGWTIPSLVSQIEDNTLNGNRYVLFASNNSVATGAAKKSNKMWFNPASGKLYVNGYIEAVQDMTATTIYANSEFVCGSGIELGAHTKESLSFIDFHWNTIMTGNDFTARICQRAENTIDLIGKNSSTWGIWRAGSFSTQSSIHVKENVQSITAEDAKRLLQLRPVTFNYKNGGLTDQAGLIAEEVYLVMPKMVIGDINYNPEEPWNAPSIDYSKFTPYLIKMVQEQQKEIDELRRLVQG